MKKIAIIGGGNLGTAIAEGLLKSKFSKASDITVTRRNTSVNPLKPGHRYHKRQQCSCKEIRRCDPCGKALSNRRPSKDN